MTRNTRSGLKFFGGLAILMLLLCYLQWIATPKYVEMHSDDYSLVLVKAVSPEELEKRIKARVNWYPVRRYTLNDNTPHTFRAELAPVPGH